MLSVGNKYYMRDINLRCCDMSRKVLLMSASSCMS